MSDAVKKIGIEVDTSLANKTLGQLEQDFANLNEAIRQVPRNSAEFRELQSQLTLTGREIRNLELSFESLDNEQVASEIGSVAGAVGDLSAAFILLGGDSESMEQIASNIQTAIGVTTAFKGAIEGVSSAMKLLNNVSLPLKLIMLAIGLVTALVVTYWDSFVVVLKKVGNAILEAIKLYFWPYIKILEYMGIIETEESKKVKNAQIERTRAIREETYKRIELLEQEIKAQKQATKDTIAELDKEMRYRRAAGQEITELELQKLSVIAMGTKAEIEDRQKKIQELASIDSIGSNLKIKNEQLYIEALQKRLAKEQEEIDLFYIAQNKTNKEQREKELAEQSKANSDAREKRKERLKILIEAQQKELERQEEQFQLLRSLRQTELENEIDEITKKYEEKLTLANGNSELEKELTLRLEREITNLRINAKNEALKKELDQQEKQYQLLESLRQTEAEKEIADLVSSYEVKFELAIGNAELEQALQQDLNNKLAEINQRYRDAEAQADREAQEKKREGVMQTITFTSNGLSNLQTINKNVLDAQLQQAEGNEAKQRELRRKSFERDKTLAIAKATIDGTQAVLSAFSGTPGGIVLKSIAATLAGVVAATNIAKIKSSTFTESGGGGSVGNVGSISQAANGVNIQPENVSTTIDGNNRVYVLESDISNTQNKVKVNEKLGTL